ncbi:APC family permease [Arthrobacter burdickii]|jgi:putrescine importer|uniref:APC family permease n=1 Tax=Arthrobacter burdickii TaxID=3035920 RepID=A0ABT8JXE8_9MICC|nr:APC family permease [Arthrobacter burdickii]MDN4609478.1 APC family permease [Arthrobacter burdickii]
MSSTSGLTAKLSLSAVVIFGLAYMSPAIVMLTFGVIASTSAGTTPLAYVLATIAMSLTALSYGKMARIIPASGSAYTYARKMIDSRVGFLVGWAILLDYLFLPMVAWLIQALYLNAQFPGIPMWGWLLVNVVATTIVNVLGIVLADRVNKTLMTLTIVGIIAFVVMCVKHLGTTAATPALDPIWNSATTIGAVSAAAAIAAYSFLGFDAVSTLSEETRDPKRNIPRAILLTALIGGAIFVSVSYVMQLVHPGGTFEDASTAAYSMSLLVGGQGFADLINTVIIIGGFASGLAIQASSSRLLYVMGRDGVLPRRFFGRLHPRFKTPVLNLLLIGAAAMFALNLSLDTATSFINFGAFLTFAMVNVCVIAYFIRERKHGKRSVLGFVVVPAIGAVVDLYLLTQLSTTAIQLGLAWLTLGIIYLAVLTKGFRKAPPEMHLDAAPAEARLPAPTH